MADPSIPSICVACVEKYQAQCPHLRTYWSGNYHYSNGEVWDDIREICTDCGLDLSTLPIQIDVSSNSDEPIPF